MISGRTYHEITNETPKWDLYSIFMQVSGLSTPFHTTTSRFYNLADNGATPFEKGVCVAFDNVWDLYGM
jgi:hypothetical protein